METRRSRTKIAYSQSQTDLQTRPSHVYLALAAFPVAAEEHLVYVDRSLLLLTIAKNVIKILI